MNGQWAGTSTVAGLHLYDFNTPLFLVQKSHEEGKVVIYTTTFRGVRSTFEECKYVLSVFHNLRVRVEERDIYVHKFYLKELEERLQGDRCTVPQVFISGQHIGVSLADTSLTAKSIKCYYS